MGDTLIAAVRRRAERGPIRAVVVAPVSAPREGYVVYRDSRRAAAGRRLERTLRALRSAGIPAHGGVFDDDPLAAVKDILAVEDVDEIIVSTHPETKSGWLRKNLVEEIRRARRGPPRRARRCRRRRERGRQRPRRRERDRPRRAASRPHPRTREGGSRELPDRLAAERSGTWRPPRGRAAPTRCARSSPVGGNRRPRPDRAPGPVHGGDERDLRRADGRDHRLDVPRRALRLASPRPRGPSSLGHGPPGRPRRLRARRERWPYERRSPWACVDGGNHVSPISPLLPRTWGTSRFPTPLLAHELETCS